MKSERRKGLVGVMLAAVLCAAASFPAMASTVSSIRLNFTDKYEVGEILEPEISCTTSGVSIDSVSWNKDVEKWTPGKKVIATIVLSSDGGKEFASSYSSKTCKVSGATLATAKGEEEKLTVTVSYYPVVQLDSPDSAGWSVTNRKKATWKKVQYATGYQLRLYRDDLFVRTITVNGTSTDLSEYMIKEANYYYEVRAVGKDTTDAKYRKASEYITSTDQLMDDMGDTEGRWKNYADGKKYLSEDGNYVTNQWYKILDLWYYFNEEGYAVKGWKQVNGLWYYMDQDGIMLTGWQKINNIWYYLNTDGSMATGWKEGAPGQWYYLNADGSMAVNTVVEGKHLNESGICID